MFGVLELSESFDSEAVSLYSLSRRVLLLAAHTSSVMEIEQLLALYADIRDALDTLVEYEETPDDPDDDLKHLLGFNYSERVADIEDRLAELTEEGIHLQLH